MIDLPGPFALAGLVDLPDFPNLANLLDLPDLSGLRAVPGGYIHSFPKISTFKKSLFPMVQNDGNVLFQKCSFFDGPTENREREIFQSNNIIHSFS